MLLTPLRLLLRLLWAFFPGLAIGLSARLFCTPTRMRLRPADARFLARATALTFPFRSRRLRAFAFGQGPSVLLVHGWGGRASQMIPWVEPLVAAGYRVIVPDMPAHGRSTGWSTTLVEFRDAVHHFASVAGPCRFVVAHSFGAAATLLAIEQLGAPVHRAVFIASPSGFDHYIDQFLDTLALPPRFWPPVQSHIESSVGVRWSELDPMRAAARLSIPVLVFHDARDSEIALHHGRRLVEVLPDARLVETEGLGHNRILRDAEVIARALQFLSSPESEAVATSQAR